LALTTDGVSAQAMPDIIPLLELEQAALIQTETRLRIDKQFAGFEEGCTSGER
jgi:hypothetical protein